jgi:hypothetical protein
MSGFTVKRTILMLGLFFTQQLAERRTSLLVFFFRQQPRKALYIAPDNKILVFARHRGTSNQIASAKSIQ